MMSEHMSLLSGVICKVIENSESWQNKKVKKTGLCVNLFVKAARSLTKPGVKGRESVIIDGAKVIKCLEKAIEADKAMSNLRGKVKEIQAVCK